MPSRLQVRPPSDAEGQAVAVERQDRFTLKSPMHPLAWLAQHRLQSLSRRENDWLFSFDGEAGLSVECLWRLLQDGRIVVTSKDHRQQFGLAAPVDAAADVNGRVGGSRVERVELREGTLDLELHFSEAAVLQVIPDSAGYEAWTASDGRMRFVAVGGGELAVYSQPPQRR